MPPPAIEPLEAYWPPEADGVALYPGVHRLAYEDDAVRVVDVCIAPRSSERPHTHARPSVMVVDRPTTLAVRWVDRRGRPRTVYERTRRPRPGAGPELQWLEPEPLHFVENTSDEPYRALRFELKAPPGVASKPPRLACGGAAARPALRANGLRGFRLRPPGRARLRVEGGGAWLIDLGGGAGVGLRAAGGADGARACEPLDLGPGRPTLWQLGPDREYELVSSKASAVPLCVVASSALGGPPRAAPDGHQVGLPAPDFKIGVGRVAAPGWAAEPRKTYDDGLPTMPRAGRRG
jgi:hypothetical protein